MTMTQSQLSYTTFEDLGSTVYRLSGLLFSETTNHKYIKCCKASMFVLV